MKNFPQASSLENITGSTVTEVVLTITAAAVGGPLLALLPVLTKSLASERQRKRIEETLYEIGKIIANHEKQILILTDSQYKLLNETLLALLHTTEVDKFQYLQRAVSNTLFENELVPQDAAVLSRLVRDISVAETNFVMENFGFTRIWLTTDQNKISENTLHINPSSPKAVIVSGLTSLGLLLSGSSDFASLGMLEWTPITTKLISILRDPSASSKEKQSE